MFEKGMISAMATSAFGGFLIGGLWLSGFRMGLNTKVGDYEREIKKLKKQIKKQNE